MSTPFIVQKESVLYGSIFISYLIYGLINILETVKTYKDTKENEKKVFMTKQKSISKIVQGEVGGDSWKLRENQ